MIAEHQSINWNTVHTRLKMGELALEAALHPDEAAIRQELARRAEQIAKPRQRQLVVENPLTLLVFAVGNGKFAVELTDVEEVGPIRQCTPVPGTPPEVCGVIHHRGEVRSVMDLARRLESASEAQIAGGYFIHVKTMCGDQLFCVDELDQVLNVSAAELATAEDEEHQSLGDLVRGIHPTGIVVLRTDALMPDDDASHRGNTIESEANHAHLSR